MVRLPRLLYLQEPCRWLYEALPAPPWAANDRPRGWSYDPAALAREAKRAIDVRRREVQVREEVRNASAFDKILCNSLYSRESILRAYGLDAKVCYLGVDPLEFAGPEATGEREGFFLTVGAAMAEKNVEFIILALGHKLDGEQSRPIVTTSTLQLVSVW
jgi:hypothetical protein